ncbi:hypothetical protein [Singulisphaera sp. GP187]|uniref:hypothetical protein n=1 Tax=Singulisphaera sp. GP187 TaxID=1882752 RepID=UPI0011613E35|nr:hypothetical protein [Singulisphaera sp. GP187]
MAAIVTAAFAGPRGLAWSGDETQKPTVLSLLLQAVVAADDALAKEFLFGAVAATLARAGYADDALRLAAGDPGSEALAWVNGRSTPATRPWGLLGVAEGLLPRVVGPNLQLASP